MITVGLVHIKYTCCTLHVNANSMTAYILSHYHMLLAEVWMRTLDCIMLDNTYHILMRPSDRPPDSWCSSFNYSLLFRWLRWMIKSSGRWFDFRNFCGASCSCCRIQESMTGISDCRCPGLVSVRTTRIW